MISRIARIKSDFFKYTAYRIYDAKSRLVILCICGVLGFPLAMFATSLQLQMQYSPSYNRYDGYNDGLQSFIMVSFFLAGLTALVVTLLTYTGGVNCYEYYNRREKVDKMLSLPVRERNRFWGDFTSGLLPLTLMYVVSAAVGLFIAKVGFPKEALTVSPDALPSIAAGMFAGLLTIFSVYIIGVFCASLCGRVYETVVYPALIMGIIPALIGLFGVMIFYDAWQLYIFDQLNIVLAGTSPGGFLICFFIELSQYRPWVEGSALKEHLTFLNPAIIIPFILVNAGFLTAAYYIAKKRGAEKTGSAFVVKFALEVIMSLVVFCITAVFCLGIAQDIGLTPGYLFALIMCTAIAFLILDVSAKRGFKKMGRAFFKYAAILTCSIVVSNVLLMADGFGIGRYVPPLNKVESVSINAAFLDSMQIGQGGYRYYYGDAANRTEYTDEEIIELVRQLNIESNNNPHNNNRNNSRYQMFQDWGHWSYSMQEITYTLSNGDTVRRKISLNSPQVERLLPLVVSDDYKLARLANIDNWLASADMVQTQNPRVTSLLGDRYSIGGSTYDAYRIYDAFKVDYLAETFEQRFYSTGTVKGTLTLNFSEVEFLPNGREVYTVSSRGLTIHILPHYTNLIKELERQGFDIWNDTSNFYEQPSALSISRYSYIGANTATIHHNWEKDATYYLDWHMERGYGDERAEELIRLLSEVAQPAHIINGEGYLLNVNNHNYGIHMAYVIPPAYNELAEELFQIARRMSEMPPQYIWDEWGMIPNPDYYDYDEDYIRKMEQAGMYV